MDVKKRKKKREDISIKFINPSHPNKVIKSNEYIRNKWLQAR